MKKQSKIQNVIILNTVTVLTITGCGGGGTTNPVKECSVKQVGAILKNSASVNVQGYGKSPVLEIDGDMYNVSTTDLIDFDENLSITNLPTDSEYNATLTYTKADDSLESCYGTIVTKTPVVPDTQKPVITLVGDSNITLNIGDTYTEQGATVTDNVDTGLTATIGGDTVDTSTAGTYVVTYSATDSAGNVANVVRRTVSVVEAINQAPTLNLDLSQSNNINDLGNDNYEGETATEVVFDMSGSIDNDGTISNYLIKDITNNNELYSGVNSSFTYTVPGNDNNISDKNIEYLLEIIDDKGAKTQKTIYINWVL